MPFVAESTVKIALSLKEIIPIKANATTMVIGEVVHILLNENLLGADGYIDHQQAQTLTVAGLDSYFRGQEVARLNYAKPNQEPSLMEIFKP